MGDTGRDDGQDFDALSEESFDFGHFHELDSDAEEPVVEHESLDPFTAAQREESFLRGSAEEETDEKFAFTQRLLTNAQTLKQLRSSGAPAIEISYDEEANLDDEIEKDQQEDPGHNQAHELLVPSQASTHAADLFQGYQEIAPQSEVSAPDRKPYSSLTQRTYKSLQSLSDNSTVKGKHHEFPARVLKRYSLDRARLILDSTRVYVPSARQCSDRICLQDIYHGRDVHDCPVFRIRAVQSPKVLLQDNHDGESCVVLAMLYDASKSHGVEAETDLYLKLINFHFDHAASTKKQSRKVTIADEVDEAFYSSADDPFPPAQAEISLDEAEEDLQSILMISQYEIVSMADLQRDWSKQEAMKRMFESDVPLSLTPGTQRTMETDYSDPFGEHLDMSDFPVNEIK